MFRKRQPQPSASLGPSALDCWVSSDSHFPPDANPPPRPPLAKTPAVPILGLGHLVSVGADGTRRSVSYGGCSSSSATAMPAVRERSGASSQSSDAASFNGRGDRHHHGADDIPAQHVSAAEAMPTRSQEATSAAQTKPSPRGRDSRSRWLGGWPVGPPVGEAASTAMGRLYSGGGASPVPSGVPETPSLRSPEKSPRRRSRSSGSVPSPLPPKTAAVTPVAPRTQPLAALASAPATEPRRQGGANSELLYHCPSDDGGADEMGPMGSRGTAVAVGGWRGSGNGDDRHNMSCTRLYARTPILGPASGGLSAGGDDLALVWGMLGAVRCAVSAMRGAHPAGRAGGKTTTGGVIASSGGGGGEHYGDQGRYNETAGGVASGFERGPDLDLDDPTAQPLPGRGTKDDAVAAAVVAAPTTVLLLVLAVRLFRAAVRWPAAVSLCGVGAGVLAAWIAAAAALFSAARFAARATRTLAWLAWTIAARCLGSTALAAAAAVAATGQVPR